MGLKIPQRSIIYLLIGFSLILIFIFGAIFPSQRTLRDLNGKIAQTSSRLAEQKALASIYETLRQRAQKQATDKEGARALPLPAKRETPRVQMDQLAGAVQEISRLARVELMSLVPALNSLSGDSKSIVMVATVRGEFYSLCRFLVGLGGLPYMEQIEEIHIQQSPDGLELRVKFGVART